MKWHFPSIIRCPKIYCNRWFESRYAARLHYCKEHAKNDLLCNVCNTLISMTAENNLINHFQRKHPNEPIPMPNSSAPTEVSQSITSKPIRANQIDESNEQSIQYTAEQSQQPIAKKIARRRQNVRKSKFSAVSTKLISISTFFQFRKCDYSIFFLFNVIF